MVIDTSVIVAVLLKEPGSPRFLAAIEEDDIRLMSAVSVAEAGIVLERRKGFETGQDLDSFLREAEIEIVPVDLEQADGARRAYRAFGRGNHPAGLNFGDCFSFALARSTDQPLLFKGNDFAQTDIAAALPA
jgi:ribonuclease VapC